MEKDPNSDRVASTSDSIGSSPTSRKRLFIIAGSILAIVLALIVWQRGYGPTSSPDGIARDGTHSGGAFGELESRVSEKSSSKEWSIANVFRSKRTETERVTTVDSSEAMSSMPPPPPPADLSPTTPYQGRTQPAPNPGILTAGDYDDLLNPDFYADYASGFLQSNASDLPFVDTREQFEIKVTDARGRAVPHVPIRIRQEGGGTITLQTAADGKALIFPRFDRIDRRARVSVGNGAALKTIDISQGTSTTVRTNLPARRVNSADILLVLDTTGSMQDEIDYLETELDDIMQRLRSSEGQTDIRIGMIVYRDQGDDYVTRKYQFTNDIQAMRATLAQQEASGGGDGPEAVEAALAEADKFQWRPRAAKILLHVADAPPHRQDIDTALRSAQTLRSKGVQFVPVAASGSDPFAEYTMRTMAVMTQGRYVFITDDSGVGNPHAEPDVDCYQVTPLNSLLARIISGMIQGRRLEASQNEVIRSVGVYNKGRCEADFSVAPGLTSRPLPVWEG